VTLRTLRRIVAVCCVGGIAGMIAGSVADNNGAAMTAGFVAAVATLCLMAAQATHVGPNGGGAQDALAAELEARVQDLVSSGTDEVALRSVVRKAVKLGRGDRDGIAAG
jgi:hypothetical protein